MKFPKNFDMAQNLGDFERINLGGHHMVITNAIETQTRTGKPMIELQLDTAPNDKQPGFFKREYDSRQPQEGQVKKWPIGGRYFIVLVDNDGNTSRNFKNMVLSVEDSNPGFTIPRDDFDVLILRGRKVGAVYGIENDVYNGRTTEKRSIFRLIADDKVDHVAAPAPKATKAYQDMASGGGPSDVPDPEWMTVDASIDDLPFK